MSALLLVGSTRAQALLNELELHSSRTNFATRVGLPITSPGDIAQRYPASMVSGIGQMTDPATGRVFERISGITAIVHDQVAMTAETFTLALIGADPLMPNQPDLNADRLRIGPLTTPPDSSPGPSAIQWTVTFATPFDSTPACDSVYLACGVNVSSGGGTDGLYIHMSGWGNPPVDNPRIATPIPTTATAIDRSSAPVSSGVADRFLRVSILTPSPVLKIGADIQPIFQITTNPNFGAAGLWPDQGLTRRDGIVLRIRDLNQPTATVFAFGSFGGPQCPGTPLLGIGGALQLDPAGIFFAGSGSISAFGLLATAPHRFRGPLGRIQFQAIVMPGGTLTNTIGFDAQ